MPNSSYDKGEFVEKDASGIHLSAVVMSHPRRAELARDMCLAHPELGLTVVSDPEPDGIPSAWRTARLAWRSVAPGATHHLVLQDDLVLVPDFATRVREAVAARPEDPLSLFVEWGSRTATTVRIAAAHGLAWAPVVDDYIPCAALVMPADVARGFDAFAAAESTESDPDDVVLLEYLARSGLTTWAAVANLAQHDAVESLVGNTTMGLRRSVNFSPLPTPGPALGNALTSVPAVPYYDWWSQQATLFVPDDSTVDGWGQIRSGPALDRWGVTPHEVEAELVGVLPQVPSVARLLDLVSRIVVSEIWKTAYLIGLVSGDLAASGGTEAPTPIAPGSAAAEALSTLPAGALRRVVPVHRLAEVGELLTPVVLAGVAAGTRRARTAGAAPAEM
ncbi:hypothetical protein AB0B50_27405 [Streptomyces sp. NPDC041068]|uniref:hypothetical protein n=1 Tax=Streptomyces sp. NPDC041068 TaxID=3155130 RepID=UPI0033F05711